MSVFRRKLASGKRSKLFTAEFQFRGKKIIRNGFPDREAAKLWAQGEQLKLKRGAVDYVKPMMQAQVSPLIITYASQLRAKGRDQMYAYTAEKRLNRLAGDCGWVTLGHVTREDLRQWLDSEQIAKAGRNRGKAIGNRTKNQYLDTAQEWGKWLASRDVAKLQVNPFDGMERLQAKHNDEYRRAATAEELNKILAACPKERLVFYLFRIYQSNVRQRTMRRLTYRMMHLDASPPFMLVPSEDDKGRTDVKYVLRFHVAQEIRALRKKTKAKASDLVFPRPVTLEDFRADMKAAGVKPEVEKDRGRIDFHALRSAFVKLGKDEGLTAFQMMDLMGWKTMQTMLRHYNKNSVDASLGASMEKLPTLGQVRKAE